MSREERRNYQRMMRDVERGPSLPPAAKARAERNAARRAARATGTGADAAAYGFTLRWWIITILVAALVGYLGFSFQWRSGMPFAAYFGLATGVVALVVLVALRVAQRTAANR